MKLSIFRSRVFGAPMASSRRAEVSFPKLWGQDLSLANEEGWIMLEGAAGTSTRIVQQSFFGGLVDIYCI